MVLADGEAGAKERAVCLFSLFPFCTHVCYIVFAYERVHTLFCICVNAQARVGACIREG